MVSIMIFVFSLAALGQFFVSYCRSLLAVYSEVEVSRQALQMAGMENGQVEGDQFPGLVQLVELCPNPGDDCTELHAIRIYYQLLNLLRGLRRVAVPIATWAERERAACAYFAAVALDRRLAARTNSIT